MVHSDPCVMPVSRRSAVHFLRAQTVEVPKVAAFLRLAADPYKRVAQEGWYVRLWKADMALAQDSLKDTATRQDIATTCTRGQ